MAITSTGKKKDGLLIYRVRVYVPQANGEKKQIERVAYGLQEAKRIEKELMNEEPEGMTFGELATLYEKAKQGEIRRSTLEKAHRILRYHVMPEFENKSIDSLTLPVLGDWKSDIGSLPLALATKQNIFIAFSAVLNYGVKMEYLAKNNLRILGNFRDNGEVVKDNRIRYYTPEQFHRFMSALPCESYAQKRIHCFYMVAFYTGARMGEINALKWSDLEGDLLHIRRSVTQRLKGVPVAETAPKNKSSIRDIRIPATLLRYLDEHRAFCSQMPGFCDDWRICGGHAVIHDSKLHAAKKKAALAAGLPEISIHEFRHSHATLLINGGVNIKEISRRLGHASVEVTWNVYSHLYPSQESKAIEVLDSV